MEFGILVSSVKKAAHTYIHNILAYLLAIILFFAVAFIISFVGLGGGLTGIVDAVKSMSFGAPLLLAVGAAFIGFLILAPLVYGMYYICIRGTRVDKVKLIDLLYGFRSMKAFIRSLVYFVVYAVILAIVGFIVTFVSVLIGSAIGIASVSIGALIAGILTFVLTLLVEIFFFFTIYIYVMTPGEGFFYALKESIRIGRSNLLMVLLTIVISWILSILIITIPLGYIFGAYMLKELDPTIRDASGMDHVV